MVYFPKSHTLVYRWRNFGNFPLLFYRCLFVYIIKRTLYGGLKKWILFSRGIKTIFYSLPALVRKILFCHSKIKFISSRHRVISSIYAANESNLIFLTKTYVHALNFPIGINPLTFWSLDLRAWLWCRVCPSICLNLSYHVIYTKQYWLRSLKSERQNILLIKKVSKQNFENWSHLYKLAFLRTLLFSCDVMPRTLNSFTLDVACYISR